MNLYLKRALVWVGRRLIMLNYTPGDMDATMLHDLRHQIHVLRQENSRLRISKLLRT